MNRGPAEVGRWPPTPLGLDANIATAETSVPHRLGTVDWANLGEVTEYGRLCLPAKEVSAQVDRGFKSHPLRQLERLRNPLKPTVSAGF